MGPSETFSMVILEYVRPDKMHAPLTCAFWFSLLVMRKRLSVLIFGFRCIVVVHINMCK